MTTVSVLTQCAESKLAKLFEKPELLPRVTGDEKTIFLDRDGPTFMNMINYLRNQRKEIPIFETTKDEHLFYRELQYWEFPDFSYLEKRLKFPDKLVDIFNSHPKSVEDQVLNSWMTLGILNLYDLVSLTSTGPMDARADFDRSLKLQNLSDPFFIYNGQTTAENKRHGFGRYISLFNGSIYEGHCKQGQQNGFGRLICKLKEGVESIEYYIGFWKDGLRHGHGKQVYQPSGKVQNGMWSNNEFISSDDFNIE